MNDFFLSGLKIENEIRKDEDMDCWTDLGQAIKRRFTTLYSENKGLQQSSMQKRQVKIIE